MSPPIVFTIRTDIEGCDPEVVAAFTRLADAKRFVRTQFPGFKADDRVYRPSRQTVTHVYREEGFGWVYIERVELDALPRGRCAKTSELPFEESS
jgi:hypothetical protein